MFLKIDDDKYKSKMYLNVKIVRNEKAQLNLQYQYISYQLINKYK